MAVSEFLRILRARSRLFLFLCATILGLFGLVLWMLPKTYSASTTVLIDTAKPREPLNDTASAAQLSGSYIGTQLDVLRSQRVAIRAVELLGLRASAVAKRIYMEETQGRGSFEQYFADRLLNRLRITPTRESNVVEIEMRGNDARFVAEAANAMARAFISIHLELRTRPAKEFSDWFESQVKLRRQDYESAQQRLSQFQQRHGITSIEERLDVETARLQELSTQMVQLQSMTVEAGKKAGVSGASARDGLVNIPEVINNPAVLQLKAELSRIEARLKEMLEYYGPNFPTVERVRTEEAALRSRLQKEIESVSASFSQQHEVNQQREGIQKGALEAQRQRILSLRKLRDQMVILSRDVETAQRAYEALSTRLVQTNLEGDNSVTNVVQLDQAVEPLEPSFPKIWLSLLVACIVAPMLATLITLSAEQFDRRPRTVSDIEALLGCRTIVLIPRSLPLFERRPWYIKWLRRSTVTEAAHA